MPVAITILLGLVLSAYHDHVKLSESQSALSSFSHAFIYLFIYIFIYLFGYCAEPHMGV